MKLHINILMSIIALCCLQSFTGIPTASGQNAATRDSYTGIWAGVLSDDDSDIEYWLILKIENGECSTLHYDCDNGSFERADYASENTMIIGNNMSYLWMNCSETAIWTETRFYALSYLNAGEMSVLVLRQVTNWLPDRTNPQFKNEWNDVARGLLSRYTDLEVLRSTLKEYYCSLGC